MENYTEIKNFLLSKTFQVYIAILSTLCFILPLNIYFLNLNIVMPMVKRLRMLMAKRYKLRK